MGCVLGGELRMMYGYYEAKWVELAVLVQIEKMGVTGENKVKGGRLRNL